MRRPFLAVVLVALGIVAPSATSPVAAPAAPVQISPPASTRVVPAPDAVDRCAARAKEVTRLKRRLRAAETTRGKARTRRLLSAARRALKRCRAQKPKPKPDPAPAPAPTPTPAPPTVTLPVAPPPPVDPGPGDPTVTVNGGSGGTFASTASLRVAATNLVALPAGWTYRLTVRTPLVRVPPFTPGCSKFPETGLTSPEQDVAFIGTAGAATFTPASRWCSGEARALVWAGPADSAYRGSNDDRAIVAFTVAP